MPKLLETYQSFVERFPKLKEFWEKVAEAGQEELLGIKTIWLVKLGIAIGAMKEGAFHSSARKALIQKIFQEEI